MSHKDADGFIEVKMDYEGNVDRTPDRVTYSIIQEYIEQNYNFKVHTDYIAEASVHWVCKCTKHRTRLKN